jgi:hypothetical protein
MRIVFVLMCGASCNKKKMIYNKGYFYLIWIIFGMVCIFSFNRLIQLFGELLIVGGIKTNIPPEFLKYINFIIFGTVALTLTFISIKILKQKKAKEYFPDYKKIRKYLLIILGIGIISKVSDFYLVNYRISISEKYLELNNIEYGDFYQSLFIYPSVILICLFLYLIVIFFILTKRAEKITKANNA